MNQKKKEYEKADFGMGTGSRNGLCQDTAEMVL